MRAGRYHGEGDVRVDDVPEPVAGDGEVRVRVAYNGLCGSDLHEIYDGARAVPLHAPNPVTGARVPVILGHEAAGFVDQIGRGVDGVHEGDLVVIEPIVPCGVCPRCAAGTYNLCDHQAFHGLSTGGGGLAEYTTVKASMVHRMPAGTDTRLAALVEPLAVAYHGVERTGARPGQSAVILGSGPIGLAVALLLRARGVACVLSEPAAHRRAVAEGLGLPTFDASAEGFDLGEATRAWVGADGADLAFDTAAGPLTFRAAVSATAKRGMVMLMASPRRPEASAVLSELLAKEIDLRASYAYAHDFPPVIETVLSGAIPVDGWVTTKPLSELNDVLTRLRSGELTKVLIDPTA
ncbi:MAG: alcohol dehydrogenase catalytic domain-containing protein [Acidimicrobiia bacterium]